MLSTLAFYDKVLGCDEYWCGTSLLNLHRTFMRIEQEDEQRVLDLHRICCGEKDEEEKLRILYLQVLNLDRIVFWEQRRRMSKEFEV